MTVSPLENSIREESARAVAAIKKKEADEIRHLEETYAAETDSFRKQTESETEARLQQEISRLSNRAVLERRKIELQGMEQFISSLVDEIMKSIRDNPLYKQFVLDALLDVAREITAGFEVRLHPEDLALENDIWASLEKGGGNRNIVVKADPTIRWGGCLVIDETAGRIFNSTLERIYYRKSLVIRQRVVKILNDHFHDKNNLSSPAAKS